MTVWFVSRHAGAVEWAKRQNLEIDRWETHLDPDAVVQGDTVIGTLPVNLASEVCARGARYLNLSLEIPFEWRGKEMTAEQLDEAGARIEHYYVGGPRLL